MALFRHIAAAIKPQSARLISSSSVQREIFKIQSPEDFEQKVTKSDKPVIVDFFATLVDVIYVLRNTIYTFFPPN